MQVWVTYRKEILGFMYIKAKLQGKHIYLTSCCTKNLLTTPHFKSTQLPALQLQDPPRWFTFPTPNLPPILSLTFDIFWQRLSVSLSVFLCPPFQQRAPFNEPVTDKSSLKRQKQIKSSLRRVCFFFRYNKILNLGMILWLATVELAAATSNICRASLL